MAYRKLPAVAKFRGVMSSGVVRIGVMGIVLALLLAACTIGPSARPLLVTSGSPNEVVATQTSAGTRAIGPGGPGRTSDPIVWADCGAQVDTVDPATKTAFSLRCGDVDVPKSYTDETAGTISLSVIKATGNQTPAGAPPLVVVRGSPGENGTRRIAEVAGSLSPQLLRRFPVVVVDLRGTGDSAPIDCVSGQNSRDLLSMGADPTTTAAAALLAKLSRGLTFDCGDLVGPELSDYSTVLAADDLDTVRAALRLDRLDVFGQGDGATLGAVYADRYPGRVDRAVLDGPADPSLTSAKLAVALAAAQEQALSSFAAACATFAGGCPLGPDPSTAVRNLVATLGDQGVSSSDGLNINGGTVVLALSEQLGTPAGWPELAGALASARSGHPDELAQIVERAPGGQDIAELQSGRIVYQCNDSAQRLGGPELSAAAKAARTQSSTFGPYDVGQVGICSSWPATETAIPALRATGAPPLLLVGAVDDPVSPYTAVRSLAAQLDSATLLTWQSGTHGAYGASRCVSAAVDAYLLNGAMPATGTLCPP